MKILLIEPYFTGSHKAWAEEYARFSAHEVSLLTMSGHYWKWRMHGGAVTLARRLIESQTNPDLILATDMLDLSTFLALTRQQTAHLPTALYFHENQLAYPWAATDRDVLNRRNNHYPFINYVSALSADRVFFNSRYNRSSFLEGLPGLLKGFPDHHELNSIPRIESKSSILSLGMDLSKFDTHRADKKPGARPLILWNHRWEYDKDPETFFKTLFVLQEKGMDFEVVILGENFSQQPEIFLEARRRLDKKVVHYGYAESFDEYAEWLWQADITPVTSNQDFFGGSLVQAMYCECFPLLPDRLAFPEHIPPNEHDRFFYQNFGTLIDRLEHCIRHIDAIRATKVSHFVSSYDWKVLAPEYDRQMEMIERLNSGEA